MNNSAVLQVWKNAAVVLYLVITVYICLASVPSMADSWRFSKLWSGFGGSGGGVFSCLTSDSSTAPAAVRWQEKKEKKRNTET